MPIDRNAQPSTPATHELDGGERALNQRAQDQRAQDRSAAAHGKPCRIPLALTEADRYRWIRANRSSFEVVDALRHSFDDSEFDAQIETAMRMSVAGPSYFGLLDDLPET